MNWSRLSRALTSNGLLLKGGCGGINHVQRLTRPSTRLSSQTGQFNARTQLNSTVDKVKSVITIAVSLFGLVSAPAYYIYLWTTVRHFENSFAHSVTPPAPVIATNTYVDRTNEKARLRELIMSPFGAGSFYHFYIGPRRSGKSQAILELVTELRKEGKKGVHYVIVGRTLYKSLARDMSMNLPVMDGLFNWPWMSTEFKADSPSEGLERVMERLAQSAKEYENGRRTTIILDGVNQLAEKERLNELHTLLESTKLHADRGFINWILVDSIGHSLDEMKKFSASSRMRLIFWSDVGEKEAKECLKKAFEAAEKKFDVDEVYKCVTGGRVGLLKEAADNAKACSTQADLIKKVTDPVVDDLTKVFSDWPNILRVHKKIFQYRILRLLAENPADVESTSSLRKRATVKYFTKKGVDCDAAIKELLKNDLLCYPDRQQLQLHSNAVKYHVLKNERGPFDG